MSIKILKWFSDTYSLITVMASIVVALIFTVGCFYFKIPLINKVILGVFLFFVFIILFIIRITETVLKHRNR